MIFVFTLVVDSACPMGDVLRARVIVKCFGLSSQTELLVVRIWYKSRESGILLFDQNFILNLRVLRWQRYTRVRIVTAHAIIETVHPSFFVVVDLLSAASVESGLNFPANKIESSWRCTEDINPILRIGNINCFFGTFFRQNICSFS